MSGYAVARIDEIDEISDGRCPWRPVRFHFGITSFGVNAFTAHQVGDRLINEHDESQEHDLQEELYLVQRGRATFELDGERVDAPAGTLVFVRPEVKRTAFAEEPGTTLVALGGTPGKAYQPQGGEIWMPLDHLYESGQYAEAADRGRKTIEAHPEYPGPLYNLACCESLAGRTDDAIKHLRLAIDGNEPFRSLAAEDTDFDPILTSPRSRSCFRVAQQSRHRASGPRRFPSAIRRRHHDDAVRLVAPRRLSRRSASFANTGACGRRVQCASGSNVGRLGL